MERSLVSSCKHKYLEGTGQQSNSSRIYHVTYDLLTPGYMTMTVIREMIPSCGVHNSPVIIAPVRTSYLTGWYCSMETPSMGVSKDVLSPLAVWITPSNMMEASQWGRKGFVIWLKLWTLCQLVKGCLAAAKIILPCYYGEQQWQCQEPTALETSEQFLKSYALRWSFHLLTYTVRGNTVDYAGQPWWNSFSNSVEFPWLFLLLIQFWLTSHYLFCYLSPQLSSLLTVLTFSVNLVFHFPCALLSFHYFWKLNYELIGLQMGFSIHFLWVSTSHYLSVSHILLGSGQI